MPDTTSPVPDRPISRGQLLLFGTAVGLVVLMLGLAAAESAFRIIDRYAFSSARLVHLPSPVVSVDALTTSYVNRLPIAHNVDRAWFTLDPEVQTGGLATADEDLRDRFAHHKGLEFASIYEWNEAYLHHVVCEEPTVYEPTFKPLEDVFAFRPRDGGQFPTHRFLRNAHLPSGLATDSFGWRAPEVALEKPADTIRIVFVGSSTTVNPHGDRFSFPEYVGRWLNAWAVSRHLTTTFEVINAGREGIDSPSIAAIVRDEVAPIDPDLVVYFGSMGFGPEIFTDSPKDVVRGHPTAASKPVHWMLEDHSALVIRLKGLVGRSVQSWHEPDKPVSTVNWPPSLHENDPELDQPAMPAGLKTILGDFDTMHAALQPAGGRLALSSFLWCAYDGMRLDPAANAGLYQFINTTYWPFAYAHLRRMADFYNRVFAKYARVHGLDFLDVADGFPLDPPLFGDAIHMVPLGIKLNGWAIFQRLVPLIEQRLDSGEWPRAARLHLARHPAFDQPARRLVRVSDVRASCDAGKASSPGPHVPN